MAETDIIYLSIFVVTTIFVLLFAIFFWQAMSSELKGTVLNDTAGSIFISLDSLANWFDGAIVVFQVICIIFLILTSFQLNTNPAYFVIMLFIVIISIFTGGIYSAVWTAMIEHPGLNETATITFPASNVLMDNYGTIALVVGVIALIFLYAKPQGRQR